MGSGFKVAIKHSYIPWNDNWNIDKPKRVKVVAEINYYNGHKSYFVTGFENNAKKYEVPESYIEELLDND